ncbi:phosphatase PAP2 family protein [Actinopolymorpha sp. B11F2]|uniref:phosphatase PAP2 family protein n=1 Tax=Actinopolymorpha sp. B11F2 TaxID=3160862 RepID=UPI0032E4D209
MMRLVRGLVAGWLLLLAFAQVVGLALVWWIFIRTPRGQVLDASVLRASTIGRSQVEDLVNLILNAVTVVSLVVATVAIGFVAVARRRYRLAVVATLLVVGANVTSQVLKRFLIERPDFDIAGTNIGAPNSMPSGHVTVAAAITVAAVLVLPSRLSGPTAVVGAAYTALTGIATLSAGWHRPSDALASLLIVGSWAAGGGYLLVVAQRNQPVSEPADSHHRTVAILALVGGSLLAVAVLATGLTDQGELTPPVDLDTSRLLGAYVAGATGVTGATFLVMAVVLSTVHRVVPKLDQPRLIDTIAEHAPLQVKSST